MAKDGNNQFRSRSGQRAKRRKTNLILNSLIVIVIVLIIIVAASIFLGGGKEDKQDTATKNKQVQSSSNNKNHKSENEATESNDSNQNTDVEDENEQDENASIDEDEGIDSEETLAEESTEPNVKKTYTNPNWNPVGTEQTEHQYSSEQGSTDWNEKERALSYATGISQDDLTVWFLERGGSDSEAIGTVTPKDQSKTYRVYLSWTDGQGWMPTKVEELIENDKK